MPGQEAALLAHLGTQIGQDADLERIGAVDDGHRMEGAPLLKPDRNHRGKLRRSFAKALQKRPVGEEQVDAAVRAVTHALRTSGERELPSRRIGEFVMEELRKLDQVAYVRFASVYRKFEDVQAFREEIERLERDLPGLEGLQLPLLDAATDKAKK